MIENFGYDQEKVSQFIGKSRSHISNTLRLLNLPQKLIDMIRFEKISQGHAKILIGLENASLLANKDAFSKPINIFACPCEIFSNLIISINF